MPPRTPARVPQTVTPICTVARNWPMLSWRPFTRAAARLPSSTRLSMRLRRAEMIAISLPEKNPLPSSRRTIEAAMKRGSDMAEGRLCYQRDRPRRRLAPARAL